MTTRVKICGLTTADAMEAAKSADFIGFIFYPPSPRNITPANAAALAKKTSANVVAVTVDATNEMLQEIVDVLKPAYLQLHGKETPARVREIKQAFLIPVIKAISVSSVADIQKADGYAEADMLMFDAKAPKTSLLPGGNGIAFDWHMLTLQPVAKPWFLSGGLNAGNVEEAMRISGATLVDVSSGVESSPGVKDPAKVRAFVDKIKKPTS